MSVYTVITPPVHSRLTTPEAVALFMGDGDPASPQLAAMVDAASDAVANYCRGRVFGRQQARETFHQQGTEASHGGYYQGGYGGYGGFGGSHDRGARGGALALRGAPIVTVDSLVEDDTTLDPGTYEIDAESGILHRLIEPGFSRRRPFGRETIVTYTAGWLLPEDDGRNLPSRYETAAILTVVALLRGAGRDPALRSVATQGVGSYAYDTSGTDVVPVAAQALLADAILDLPIS